MKLLTLLFKKVSLKIKKRLQGRPNFELHQKYTNCEPYQNCKNISKQQNEALVARFLKRGSFKKGQGRSRMAELLIKLQPRVQRDAKGI